MLRCCQPLFSVGTIEISDKNKHYPRERERDDNDMTLPCVTLRRFVLRNMMLRYASHTHHHTHAEIEREREREGERERENATEMERDRKRRRWVGTRRRDA